MLTGSQSLKYHLPDWMALLHGHLTVGGTHTMVNSLCHSVSSIVNRYYVALVFIYTNSMLGGYLEELMERK